MKIFDRRNELLPKDQLEQLQLERLQALLARLKRSVHRYRELLGDARVESLAELKNLPLTSPDDVALSFPYGIFALPLREVIRLQSAFGPEGKPLVIGHTRNDLAQWGRLVARQLVAAGVTANDIIQIALGGSNHWGAVGYLLGAELIEASIIAEDPLHIDSQLALLLNYRPTILITTPLNALRLIGEMERRRIDPQSLPLKTVMVTRPVDEEVRAQLRSGLFADVKCNFGVDLTMAPGFCLECDAGRFHANEDQYLFEIIGGELVITTLCREAVPLLRYRTRVSCAAVTEECPCGRTGRIFKPGERLDGRMLVAETPLYECQIAEVLIQCGLEGIDYKFQAFEQYFDIEVRVTSELFSDTVKKIERLRNAIQVEFRMRFGIEARVQFIAGGPKK